MNVIYKRKELVGIKRLEKMPVKIKWEDSIFVYSHKESMGIGTTIVTIMVIHTTITLLNL